jgi:hypothetical protein
MFSPLLVSVILPGSLLLLLYHVPAKKATGFMRNIGQEEWWLDKSFISA